MGYIRHHAIVVTSWDRKALDEASGAAVDADCYVTDPVASPVNGYWTFVVVPDGSKEGWPESDAGDAQRARFIEWLNAHAYDDGSSCYAWVEVQYGDDNGDQRVLAASDLMPAPAPST